MHFMARYFQTMKLLYNFLSGPLDTKFCEGLDIPGTANTFVQGEIETLSMDDWMKTFSKTTCHANLILISI